MSSWAEISAMVFGQHIHPALILVIFSSVVLRRTNLQLKTLVRRMNRKYSKETANIPAEQLQRVNQNLFCWCKKCLCVGGTAFSWPPVICEMLTTSFQILSTNRHIDSLAKFICTSQPAVHRSTKVRTPLHILTELLAAPLLGVIFA
jgi:hypothetical protein